MVLEVNKAVSRARVVRVKVAKAKVVKVKVVKVSVKAVWAKDRAKAVWARVRARAEWARAAVRVARVVSPAANRARDNQASVEPSRANPASSRAKWAKANRAAPAVPASSPANKGLLRFRRFDRIEITSQN